MITWGWQNLLVALDTQEGGCSCGGFASSCFPFLTGDSSLFLVKGYCCNVAVVSQFAGLHYAVSGVNLGVNYNFYWVSF